jgi:hypothetical protein
MFESLKMIRNRSKDKKNIRLAVLYALGEGFLVILGILIALQVDNWNQKRQEFKSQIENLENFHLTANEYMNLSHVNLLVEDALKGERLWLDFLEEKIPYNDSLMMYGYLIGVTDGIIYNEGAYESLKMKGMELIESSELRKLLSSLYDEIYPNINKAMVSFYDRFEKERIGYFKEYFELDLNTTYSHGFSTGSFDYSSHRIKRLKNPEAMRNDEDFHEFVKISFSFHREFLLQLERYIALVNRSRERLIYEINYLKSGTPRKTRYTFRLHGYQEADIIYVSGEFNGWASDEFMFKTRDGWERSFELFPGKYEYQYIIDGESWILDPANPDSVFVPEIPTYNSVLTIEE